MIPRIPTEQIGARNAVFLAIVCREIRPYAHYEKATEAERNQPVPRVLMQLRADGRLGFPGGGVEEGETLRIALKRELKQEIDFELDENLPIPVCSSGNGDFNAHLYAIEVDETTFRQAAAKAINAEHADSELCGVVTPNIEFKGSTKGIAAILQAPMPFSGKADFIVLLEQLGLLSKADLSALHELLPA